MISTFELETIVTIDTRCGVTNGLGVFCTRVLKRGCRSLNPVNINTRCYVNYQHKCSYRCSFGDHVYTKICLYHNFLSWPFKCAHVHYIPLSMQSCYYSWWRHLMDTFSALLAICAGNTPVPGEFPAQKPVTQSFDVFFDLRLNKRLSKQSWGWSFETPSRPLWFHCNVPLPSRRPWRIWINQRWFCAWAQPMRDDVTM